MEQVPKTINEGPLKIGEIQFDCAVLDDDAERPSRVISEQKFMAAMGMYRSGALSTRRKDGEGGGANIPLFLAHKNLKPFAERHLGGVHFEPLKYKTADGNIAHGIKAEIIPKICEIWIDADREIKLGATQKRIAKNADRLLRGFAHVGIIALVDEATGYQAKRDKKALQAILDKYLTADFAKWAKRFPDDFYREMFRLRGWQWKGMKVNRPSVVGHYTNDIVYDRIVPGSDFRGKLRELNPKDEQGNTAHRDHLHLTPDLGLPRLDMHLYAVIGLMRASQTWDQFMRSLQRAFPKENSTRLLPLDQ